VRSASPCSAKKFNSSANTKSVVTNRARRRLLALLERTRVEPVALVQDCNEEVCIDEDFLHRMPRRKYASRFDAASSGSLAQRSSGTTATVTRIAALVTSESPLRIE
jgi:hypothetical protein